jgi:two-component system response regulator ParR
VVCSVLVIDNDITLTDVLKATLDSNTFQVYAAHVIILDLYLPEKDGSQVCRDIRAFSDTPILILSVLNNPKAIARALDEGADDYLIKPVKSGVLAAHLKKLIRRNNRAQTSIKTH